jgi:hypothetical protein
VHRHEPGGPLLTTLRVGRLFQEAIFSVLVPDEEARSAVSREHFQIWADEMCAPSVGSSPPAGGIPCYFFLTNFSVNGTHVNGKHYQGRGDQVQLHGGDIIAFKKNVPTDEGVALASFLEFRFELSGSILADADAPAPAVVKSDANNPADVEVSVLEQRSAARRLTKVAQTDLNVDSYLPNPISSVIPSNPYESATSFLMEPFEPLFVLEAGGTAVRADLQPEHRRITHGSPQRRAGGEELACPPLILGRAHQQDFWSRLLTDEAFNSLSRQHLRIDACDDRLAGRLSTFYVQNLSARNPIRITSSQQLGLEDILQFGSQPLEFEERQVLNHSDVITLNPNVACSLWLVFVDVSQRQYVPVQ